jgi:hypothetical protein
MNETICRCISVIWRPDRTVLFPPLFSIRKRIRWVLQARSFKSPVAYAFVIVSIGAGLVELALYRYPRLYSLHIKNVRGWTL